MIKLQFLVGDLHGGLSGSATSTVADGDVPRALPADVGRDFLACTRRRASLIVSATKISRNFSISSESYMSMVMSGNSFGEFMSGSVKFRRSKPV